MSFPHFRRNFFALLGGSTGFFVGITLAGTTTVLPLLVATLTGSAIAVGLLATVSQGAFLIPQLFFANLLTDKTHKKSYLLLGSAIGRPVHIYYAILLALGLYRYPTLAVLLLYGAQIIFFAADALVSVAWFDIVGKVLPATRRGRYLGGSQLISGLLAVGAGAFIAAMLGENGPAYPANYVVILLLAGFSFILGFLSWVFLVEPRDAVEQRRPAWRDYLPELAQTLRQDRPFARLIMVRLLAGFDALVIGFYVLFATRELGLPPQTVGLFIAAQTAGRILAGVGLGALAERAGGQRVIQVGTAINVTAPLLALVLVLVDASAGPATTAAFFWIFMTMGITMGATMLGFLNYTLELAPEGKRPLYVALLNTISGLLIILPTLGGWILQESSFAVLFSLAAVVLVLAHLMSYSLPSLYRCVSPVGGEAGVVAPES